MNCPTKLFHLPRYFVLVLGVSLLVAHTGCVSTRYKLAKKETIRPALAYDITATPSEVEATVNTAIVFQGPGSWKRDAYWDEYVLTLVNRGDRTLTVETAALTGLAGTSAMSGVNPWALEKQSRTLADQGFGLTKDVAVQIGGGVAYVVAGTGVGAGVGALVWGTTGLVPGTALGILTGMIAVPAFIGGSIYANVHSRHGIEREFARRRLLLPLALAPGQTTQGSLFFPITPGPQRLALHCAVSGAEPRDVFLNLAPLAGLHLQSASPALPTATLTSP